MNKRLFSLEYNEALARNLHAEIDNLFSTPDPNPARRVMGMMAYLCGTLQALGEELPHEPQWVELATALNKVGEEILDKHDARHRTRQASETVQ